MLGSISDRVHRGAEYLDAVRLGWAHEIDLDTLDMHSDENCVLGQLFLDYCTAKYCLGISFEQEITLGFYALSSGDYTELTEHWCQEIQDRQDTSV